MPKVRMNLSTPTVSGPSISDNLPEARRRLNSICQGRSVACKKPRVYHASSRLLALIWGMALSSNLIVTGLLMPGAISSAFNLSRVDSQ